MSTTELNALEFKNVGKVYKLPHGGKVEALKSFSLSIPKGEFFGLLGHNGAGKTTAINILAGVNKPTTGDILVHGNSVVNDPEMTKRIVGVVQQELLVDSFFKLPTMLKIQSKLYGVVPDLEWINLLLEKLKLKEHYKKTTRELSGGMKRRMMIARALVHKPRVLILDEPTAGVDVQLRHSMWEFIKELHETGITIILTTHYLEEAENFCTRIGIMKNGELVTLKKNKDLLSLGGEPKFNFVLKFSSNLGSNSSEKMLADIKESFHFKDAQIEFVSELSHNDEKKIKISSHMSYQNLEYVNLYIEKIKELAEAKNLTIESFYTEQPSLEEVFLKINNGNIVS
ncbi:MAG: ABC transporter ATP-binding protein [Bdellovibrionota bacterium]